MGADSVKGVIDEISMAFQEQAADAERLDAAIQKYGFTFEEVGAKLQQSTINDQAKELIEDWRVLIQSGIDFSAVNAHMAESINSFLATALSVGAEIPAAMKPILESMVTQGLLTDANGVKITDLGTVGINWAETMTAGFDRVVAKLQQLIDTLQLAGSAISDLPSVPSMSAGTALPAGDMPMTGADEYLGEGVWNRYAPHIDPETGLYTDGSTPGDPSGTGATVPTNEYDYQSAAAGGTTVVFQGDIYGNPQDLADIVIEGLAAGGQTASTYRIVHNQLVPS
jgi:methyl-accepting chemotaxis protein